VQSPEQFPAGVAVQMSVMLVLCIVIGLLQVLTTTTLPTSNTTAPLPVTPTTTPAGNCSGDCTCECNMNYLLFLTDNILTTATCSNGVWTVNGDLSIPGNVNWNFQSDTILLSGNFASVSPAQLTISINPDSGSKSFFIAVSGSVTLTGSLIVDLLDAPVDPTVSVPFMYYPVGGVFQLSVSNPTLPEAFLLCRTAMDSGITTTTHGNNVTQSYVTNIEARAGCDCVTGCNRSWVIALMILAGVHALIILVFCLVTCKNDELYTKVWDN